MTAAAELSEFFVHTVEVETRLEDGPWGERYGPPVTVLCFVDESRKYVRDGAGREVVSEASLTAAVEDADRFQPGSRVTVHGRRAAVIGVARATSGDLELPDHVEVTLT